MKFIYWGYSLHKKHIESGATTTEYALVLATIAIVLVGALVVMGSQIESLWISMTDDLVGVP